MNVEQIQAYEFHDFGTSFIFNVDNPGDIIQRHFVKGELYEKEELEIIRRHSTGAKIFYDIGSNVGNHALFMAKVLGASKVYVFEANGRAIDLLERNISSNQLQDIVNSSHLGVGIGKEAGNLTVFNPQTNNLGAARLKKAGEDELGSEGYFSSVDIVSIDCLNLTFLPDFVKIDVEGMELEVLAGMASAIERSRPRMFIEVNNANQSEFLNWVEKNDYEVIETFSRYKSNVNFMVAPIA
jgi:FkbM family methyltransferase